MKRGIVTSLAVLLAWSCGSNFASAQFGSLGQQPLRPRPTVSPYINLGAGVGALSYYGLVRPQVDTTRQLMSLQNTLTQMNPDGSLRSSLDQQQSQTGSPGTGLQTGHAATYFNYSHYYPLSGMGSQGGPSFLSGMGGLNPGVGGGAFGTGGIGGGAFGGSRTGGPSIVIGVGR
jgi:hypothetical protein